MKTKPVVSDLREVRLTVRITKSDLARLERLRLMVNPYGNKESRAKVVSAALFIADEKLSKGARS